MKISRAIAVVVIASLVLTGCASPKQPSSEPRTASLSAPSLVSLSGEDLVLEAQLNRDFMPVSPPGGLGTLAITTADGSPVPESIRVERVWILHEGEVWSTTPADDEVPEQDPSRRTVIVRDWPGWESGTSVDVVVLLSDEAGESALLGVVDQRISETH